MQVIWHRHIENGTYRIRTRETFTTNIRQVVARGDIPFWPDGLLAAIDGVVATWPSCRLFLTVGKPATRRPRIAAALRTAASAAPPWRSLDAIAREACCSLRMLKSEFRAAFGTGNRTIMR
jgi:transcriptional regulator GlxA family with amidase domain